MGMFIDTLNFVALAKSPAQSRTGGIALSSIGPKSRVSGGKRLHRPFAGRRADGTRNHPATVEAVAGMLAIFGGGRAA